MEIYYLSWGAGFLCNIQWLSSLVVCPCPKLHTSEHHACHKLSWMISDAVADVAILSESIQWWALLPIIFLGVL